MVGYEYYCVEGCSLRGQRCRIFWRVFKSRIIGTGIILIKFRRTDIKVIVGERGREGYIFGSEEEYF